MKFLTQFLLIFGFLVEFSLGLFVYLKDKKKQINIFFFLMMASGSMWSLFLFLSMFFTDNIARKLSIFWGPLASAFFLLFTIAFKRNGKLKSWEIALPIIGSLFFSLIIVFTDMILEEITLFSDGSFIYSDGPYVIFFYLFYLFYLFYTIFSFYFLISGCIKSSGIRRAQFQYIILGFGVALFFFFIFNLILPIFEIFYFSSLSSFAFLFLALFIIYVITRHRFLDIKLVFKKGTAHLISILLILALYSTFILFNQKILIEKHHWNFLATIIISVLIIAITVEPIRKFFFNMFRGLLYSRKEKERAGLSARTDDMREKEKLYAQKIELAKNAIENIENFISEMVSTYLSFLSASEINFLIADSNTKKFENIYSREENISIEPTNHLHIYISHNPSVLVTQEIPFLIEDESQHEKDYLKDVQKYLKKNKIAVVLPIGDRDHIMGFFFIGPKENNDAYSKEDIDALIDFKTIVSPILLNLILYSKGIEGIQI
ncbi:hypothetical protein KKC88_06015 [Patescibacteria group bacterium]|nr:hypothetical protein [Patescibacteria group bacterium]